jgi:MurNAc alpha-1-phosphate uridylyltransferase
MKTAMILAAGRGERMRPLTDFKPKPLLEVQGVPLIQYHVKALKLAGFERVVINHAWLGEQIERNLGNGEHFGLDILYSPEESALETAGGIIKALPLLCPQVEDKYFAVINADVFCDFDFGTLPSSLTQCSAHLVMVDNPEHNPEGDFYLNGESLQETEGEKLTFSGIAFYHKRFFQKLLEQNVPVMGLAPLLKEAIKQGMVSGEKHVGNWSDVGTPERLAILNTNN